MHKRILAITLAMLLALPLPVVAVTPTSQPSATVEPQMGAAVVAVRGQVLSWMRLTITGGAAYEPGDSVNHLISLTTTAQPDLDWSDGTYAPLYGGWALLDSDGNIVTSSDWTMLSGSDYQATAVFNAPSELGNYALVAFIVRLPQTYNTATKTWTIGTQEVVAREAAQIKVTILTQPSPEYPTLSELLSSIWNWLRSLFGWI